MNIIEFLILILCVLLFHLSAVSDLKSNYEMDDARFLKFQKSLAEKNRDLK